MAASFIGRCLTFTGLSFSIRHGCHHYRYYRFRFQNGILKQSRASHGSWPKAGLGVSLAFLGFSIGKKNDIEEAEVDILTRTYRAARLAHHQRDFERADELYHQCLKIADGQVKREEITKEKHLTTRTLAYDGLADIALKEGHTETAKKLFIETMKGCINQGMAMDSNVIIEISLKLSSIYVMEGKKEEAEEGYKFCVQSLSHKLEDLEKKWTEQEKKYKKLVYPADKLEEKEQNTAALLGMTLGSYGRYLIHERRYTEALPLLERALLYTKHILGTNSNQYIIVLNDLATLHIMSKKFDAAEKILNDGIVISEKAKLFETALLYCNLGAIYLRRGQPEAASKTCQVGLARAKEFDHQMAFRMAEACIKKSATVLQQAKTL